MTIALTGNKTRKKRFSGFASHDLHASAVRLNLPSIGNCNTGSLHKSEKSPFEEKTVTQGRMKESNAESWS